MAKRAKPKHYTDDFKRDAVRLMEKRSTESFIYPNYVAVANSRLSE